MTKPYLLIAGYNYHPEQGTGDWIGCYKTEEEAKKYWDELKMGQATLEWYEIVDLRDWMDWIGEVE